MSRRKSRAKLTADLANLKAKLADIDTQGERLIALHRDLVAQRQALSGAIQYIESSLKT